MKHLKSFIGLIAIVFLSLNLNAQTILIDSTFTSDTEIFPFTPGTNIYGIDVSGEVTLHSDTSLVRLILIDSSFNEYLLYESYRLISSSYNFEIINKSDETKFLDETMPYSIEIQLIDAEIIIDSLNLSLSINPSYSIDQKTAKNLLEVQKVENIRSYISENNFLWVADTNEISQLSYDDKKSLFGSNYNTLGIEFYKGGLYQHPYQTFYIEEEPFVSEFDWRNRHGSNNPDI